MCVSRLRTLVKKLHSLIEANDAKSASALFPDVQSELMKNVSKGTLKKNTASRTISRIAAKIKKIS